MKTRTLYLLLLAALVLTGCKQNDWMDWKLQNELWLQANAEKEGVQVAKSGSGLQYKVLSTGNPTDTKPNPNSQVMVDYKMSLINGRQVDAGTQSFNVYELVAGAQEGLRMMNVHSDYVFYIPWNLGYSDEGKGAEGNDKFIPPYSTLIFEVHLSAVNN